MPRISSVVAAVVLVACLTAPAMIAEPYPRIFASQWGTVAVKILPDPNNFQASTAVCFTLNKDGSEKELWRKALVNLPGQVLVYDSGGKRFLVTLDTWGHAGGPNSLVIYSGDKGDVIASLTDQQITGQAPPAAAPIRMNGGRPWLRKADLLSADPTKPQLRLTLTDDRTILIDLTTGKPVP